MKVDDGLKERAKIFMKMTSDVESMQETPTVLFSLLKFLYQKPFRLYNWVS